MNLASRGLLHSGIPLLCRAHSPCIAGTRPEERWKICILRADARTAASGIAYCMFVAPLLYRELAACPCTFAPRAMLYRHTRLIDVNPDFGLLCSVRIARQLRETVIVPPSTHHVEACSRTAAHSPPGRCAPWHRQAAPAEAHGCCCRHTGGPHRCAQGRWETGYLFRA